MYVASYIGTFVLSYIIATTFVRSTKVRKYFRTFVFHNNMDVYSFTCPPQMHGKVNRSCTSVRVLRSSLISVTITCGIVCLAFPNCWKTVRLRVNDSASEALSDGFSIFSAEPTSITRRSKASFVSNACVVVEQARYLKNVGGAHIGHWVAVLT